MDLNEQLNILNHTLFEKRSKLKSIDISTFDLKPDIYQLIKEIKDLEAEKLNLEGQILSKQEDNK